MERGVDSGGQGRQRGEERRATTFDLDAIAATLRSTCPGDDWMARWMARAWNDPDAFRAALHAQASSRKVGGTKVHPTLGVDFFYDGLVGHGAGSRAAWIAYDRGDLRSVTYDTLADRVTSLVRVWRDAKVPVGACVALVLSLDDDYLVALYAALHMGLVAAPIPPYGETYVQARLAQLKPEYVAARASRRWTLPKGMTLLPVSAPFQPTSHGSYTYEPDEIALRLFSAFRSFDAPPRDVAAGELHDAVLRDGLLAYGLDAADRVAMPGYDPVQLQPLALMTVLRAGATWVELQPEDTKRDRHALKRSGTTLLGVTRRTRKLLLDAGVAELPPLRAWFRLLNEAFDYEGWERLRVVLSGEKIPGYGLLPSAASGGVHLSTLPTLKPKPLTVWPAPGRSWQLSQLGSDGLRSFHPSGVYTALRVDARSKKPEPEPSLVRMTLSKLGAGFALGGAIDGWPDGRALPLREIGQVAARHPRVGAAGAAIAPGQWANEAKLVVGLFVPTAAEDGSVDDQATLLEDVNALLEEELGPTCVPGRIDVIPLYPRWKGEDVDLDWFRTQMLGGAFDGRAREPLFVALAQLAWTFGGRLLGQAAAAGVDDERGG